MHGDVIVGGWADTIRQCPNGTEYVRADIHAQTIAANAALEAVVKARIIISVGHDLMPYTNWQDRARAFLAGGE
jgi:hypothetical protein